MCQKLILIAVYIDKIERERKKKKKKNQKKSRFFFRKNRVFSNSDYDK